MVDTVLLAMVYRTKTHSDIKTKETMIAMIPSGTLTSHILLFWSVRSKRRAGKTQPARPHSIPHVITTPTLIALHLVFHTSKHRRNQ